MLHLKICAVLFDEELNTPSQQIVNVRVGEDLQGYRGDDQVRAVNKGCLIWLEYVYDGYEDDLEGHRSKDNVQF